MRIPRSKRVHAAAAIITALAGVATMSLPANALPPPGGDPVEVPDRADLKVSALTVAPTGTTWSLSYTVANTGLVSAGSTTLAFGGGPGTAPRWPSGRWHRMRPAPARCSSPEPTATCS